MELEKSTKQTIAKNDGLEQVEAALLNRPQMPAPVQHYFGPGIYIRQITFLPGCLAVGNKHKRPCLNIMLEGKVVMINDDKTEAHEIVAPTIFTTEPGKQKMGFIVEKTVWLNLFATDETNIEKLEEMLFEHDETGQSYMDSEAEKEHASREDDRQDFRNLIAKIGLTEEEVRQETESTADQIDMPAPWNVSITVRESQIQGKGVFTSWPIKTGDIVVPLRLNGMRTPAGRYANHSKNPNCEITCLDNGDIYLKALRPIHGCLGGSKGEEITLDYRGPLSLSKYKELL